MRDSINSRNSSMNLYMREISQTELLTPEDEVRLADRIKQGDNAAREHMIKANLRLVVKIAQDYSNYGLPLEDLISEGNIGLMKAVERFDPEKGGKVSTYAAWGIKQSINKALANQSKTVRLPFHIIHKLTKLRRIESSYLEEFGKDPTDEDLSEILGIPIKKIALLRQQGKKLTSLDEPIGIDGDGTYGDVIEDENAVAPDVVAALRETKTDAISILDVLEEREFKIIESRFGLSGQSPKTLEQVGRDFGVTRERVRQLQNIALGKIRKSLAKEAGANGFNGCEDEQDSVWGNAKNSARGTKRLREGALEFTHAAEVTWEHLNKLPTQEKVILTIWYSHFSNGQDPSTITNWVNSELKVKLAEQDVQGAREKGVLRLAKIIYGKVVKKDDLVVQQKIMDGLRNLLKRAV